MRRINPELGGEEGFARLTDALKEHGLGLDPRHRAEPHGRRRRRQRVVAVGAGMGRAVALRPRLRHRLGAPRREPASSIVPFLGDRYGEALEKGELKLAFDAEEGSFSVWHWEHRFPVCPLSYPIVLDRALAALSGRRRAADARTCSAISERLRTMNEERRPSAARLPGRERGAQAAPRRGGRGARRRCSRRSSAPCPSSTARRASRRASGRCTGSSKRKPTGSRIGASRQATSTTAASSTSTASRACASRIRRSSSAATRRSSGSSARAASRACASTTSTGWRIRRAMSAPCKAPSDPASTSSSRRSSSPAKRCGRGPSPARPATTSSISSTACSSTRRGRRAFERIYRDATGLEGRYGALLREAKAEILETSFASELEVLVSDLKRLADSDRRTRDYTVFAIRRALVEIIARFPVYRSYLGDGEPTPGGQGADRGDGRRGEARRASCPTGPCTTSSPRAPAADRGRWGGRPERGSRSPLPPPLPAAHRPGHGEEPRGHPLLPLCPPRCR